MIVQTVVDEIYGGLWAPAPLLIDEEDWSLAWVAIVDSSIVGMILTGEEWISDLWVLRENRGCGVGKRLLAQGEAEIAGRGCGTFRLRVVKSNTMAVGFYLRQGWLIEREFPNERLPVTMLEMTKSANGATQAFLLFRPLARSDFPLLQEWLCAPHVAAWWHECLDLEGVDAKYGPRVDGAEPTHVFVIEYAGRPVGWIQWYRWSDYPEHALQLGAESTSAGIDLAIGELAMTGLGLGPVVIREFVRQIVLADPGLSAVITDPEEGNLRSLGAFRKAGFTVTNTVQLAGENFKRRVVRIDR